MSKEKQFFDISIFKSVPPAMIISNLSAPGLNTGNEIECLLRLRIPLISSENFISIDVHVLRSIEYF